MNKQDYIKELNRLEEIHIKTQLVRDLLVREFKLECTHDAEFIRAKTDYNEDEYGRAYWNTQTYTCENCGSQLCKNKGEFKTYEEISVAISNKIKKEYLL